MLRSAVPRTRRFGRPTAWIVVAVGALPLPSGAGLATTVSANPVVVAAPREDTALQFDATSKAYVARSGEPHHTFHFAVLNSSDHEVVINQVRTSCGCTIAKLPAQPWHLAPGAAGDLQLIVDLRGESGVIVKTATVDTATTFKDLTIKVTIPPPQRTAISVQDRERNRQLAAANPPAIFSGECALCHAKPAAGRFGADLYVSACSICHDASDRAPMVPDLHHLNHPTDAAFWRSLIANGRARTLMPAFAQTRGGSLTDAQIDSLVTYLTGAFAQSVLPAAQHPRTSSAAR